MAIPVGVVIYEVTAFGILLLVGYVFFPIFTNENMLDPVERDHAVVIIQVCGVTAGLIGAFVVAWVAGRAEVQHALAFGAIVTALAVLYPPENLGDWPLWGVISRLLLPIPVCWVGGYLRKIVRSRRKSRDRSPVLN